MRAITEVDWQQGSRMGDKGELRTLSRSMSREKIKVVQKLPAGKAWIDWQLQLRMATDQRSPTREYIGGRRKKKAVSDNNGCHAVDANRIQTAFANAKERILWEEWKSLYRSIKNESNYRLSPTKEYPRLADYYSPLQVVDVQGMYATVACRPCCH